MKVTYVPIRAAKKDIFKTVEVKEAINYDNFIDELKAVDINQEDVLKEIASVIKKTDVSNEVKREILKRLEVKNESR